jgi:hypothetical protein
MRKALLAVAIAVAPFGVRAQNLQDQIDSVYRAQQQQEASQRAAYDAQQAAILRQHQQQIAAENARIAAAAALQKQREEAAQADKLRNQAYEDQLRDLNLERQKAQLEALKARAARENDYINADLAHQSAETDVVRSEADRTRSEADANRNVSSGVKNFLDQSGAAAVERASSPGETKKTAQKGE